MNVSPGYMEAKDKLCDDYLARIRTLEAALREIAQCHASGQCFGYVARAALAAKNEGL